MSQTWLSAVIWFPFGAVTVLVSIFILRRLWRELPFFFFYLACALLVAVARYSSFYLSRKAYFYSYWISDLVGAPSVFLAIYEVFLRRLFPRFQRVRFYRNLFAIVAFAILLLTVLTALQARDKGAAFQAASRAFDFARTAMLVFFIGLMAFMGRQWTKYDLGITLGFGIQAAVALANAAVRTQMHYKPTFMETVQIVAYNVTCIIWLITFWKPEKPAQLTPAAQLDPEMLKQARSWEEQLKDWIDPRKSKR